MVRQLLAEGRDFGTMSMAEWREASDMFGDDAPKAATALASVQAKRTPQSTNPDAVRAARLADEHNRKLNRPLQYQNGGRIRYVIATAGPEPLEARSTPLDYDHYVTKQLQPVAEGILPFVEGDFATLITGQLGLF